MQDAAWLTRIVMAVPDGIKQAVSRTRRLLLPRLAPLPELQEFADEEVTELLRLAAGPFSEANGNQAL